MIYENMTKKNLWTFPFKSMTIIKPFRIPEFFSRYITKIKNNFFFIIIKLEKVDMRKYDKFLVSEFILFMIVLLMEVAKNLKLFQIYVHIYIKFCK